MACSPDPSAYAELAAATNFSFLCGASHPTEMVESAIALGMSGIGIADRNTVAGVVRAHVAWKDAVQDGRAPPGFRLVMGARLCFADDTPDIFAYPATRHGWGRLTRLLTVGNRCRLKSDKPPNTTLAKPYREVPIIDLPQFLAVHDSALHHAVNQRNAIISTHIVQQRGQFEIAESTGSDRGKIGIAVVALAERVAIDEIEMEERRERVGITATHRVDAGLLQS